MKEKKQYENESKNDDRDMKDEKKRVETECSSRKEGNEKFFPRVESMMGSHGRRWRTEGSDRENGGGWME